MDINNKRIKLEETYNLCELNPDVVDHCFSFCPQKT